MQIRYLHSLQVAIISTRGKEFYITPDKEEWEWLFKLLKREAEPLTALIFPEPQIKLSSTDTLIVDYLARGGHIKGRELTLEDLDL